MIEIISHSGGHDFTIRRNGKKVCSLRKKGWFEGPAKGVVNNEVIHFKSTGLFQNKYDIIKNDKICGQIRFYWHGGVIISLKRADGQDDDVFDLKAKNWLGVSYKLINRDEGHIVTFLGKFSWSFFNYKFIIEEADHNYLDQELDELLLYSVYAKKLHLKNQGYV